MLATLMMLAPLTAEEAREAGYLSAIVEADKIAAHADELLGRIVQHAPITMQVGKEAIRCLSVVTAEDEDLIRRAYGSADFREGVAAFVAKRKPVWTGR